METVALQGVQEIQNGLSRARSEKSCEPYPALAGTFFLLPGSVSYMPLMSIPGSGNTWVRYYLIESLTGAFTGDHYTVTAV